MLHPPTPFRPFRLSGATFALLGALLWAVFPAAAGVRADPAPAAPEGVQEVWFVLELGGRPAGWAVERWWYDGERAVTEEELKVRLARGASDLEISLAGRFEETADGAPIRLWTRQALGSEPVETTYRFLAERVEAVSVQGERTQRELLPLPEGDWLTPAAARRAVRAHHAADARRYELRAIEPLEGIEPVTTVRTRIGDGEESAGAGRWREETSASPGVPSVVVLDEQGRLIRSVTEIFGMEAVAYRSGRDEAMAAAVDGAAPEVMVRTLLRPDRPILEPRRAARATYRLSLANGEPMPVLPSSGAQTVEPVDSRGASLRVTVARDAGAAPEPPPPVDSDTAASGAGAPGRVTAAHLQPTLYLDHEDPAVRGLLERIRPPDADRGSADAAERARRLADLVHRHVRRKDLDTGFATASEVARDGRGDCTEHAVLLAALLRADGIPSRVVTGLVYLDDFAGAESVFGYHMWVQAALPAPGPNGSPHGTGALAWVDLDPTLPWGFDATHIALGHSDLAGGGLDPGLDRMLPLIGNLRISVVEVEAPDDRADPAD